MSLFDGPETQATSGSEQQQQSQQQTSTQQVNASGGSNASTTASNIADWARPYAQDALAMGRGVSNQQFEKYDPSGISRYTNPYTDAVLKPTLRNINEGAANEMAGIASKARSLGAFGGSRQGVLEAEADQNRLQAIGDATARAKSDAYNQALGIDLGEFNRERNWGSERLQDYLSAVSGVPIDRTTSSQNVSSNQNVSGVSQLVGSQSQGAKSGFGNQSTDNGIMSDLGSIAGMAAAAMALFSDPKMKTAKRKMSGKEVLALLDEIEPGQEWEYKHVPGMKRIGPMADDMQKHAGIGNGRMLPPNEMASLSLAAVKALRDEMNTAKA